MKPQLRDERHVVLSNIDMPLLSELGLFSSLSYRHVAPTALSATHQATNEPLFIGPSDQSRLVGF
ncbi:hypothetical protein BH20VER3_BH20VER3_01240 [soil metagenome]